MSHESACFKVPQSAADCGKSVGGCVTAAREIRMTDNYTVARRSALAKAVYASKGGVWLKHELASCNTLAIAHVVVYGAVFELINRFRLAESQTATP